MTGAAKTAVPFIVAILLLAGLLVFTLVTEQESLRTAKLIMDRQDAMERRQTLEEGRAQMQIGIMRQALMSCQCVGNTMFDQGVTQCFDLAGCDEDGTPGLSR